MSVPPLNTPYLFLQSRPLKLFNFLFPPKKRETLSLLLSVVGPLLSIMPRRKQIPNLFIHWMEEKGKEKLPPEDRRDKDTKPENRHWWLEGQCLLTLHASNSLQEWRAFVQTLSWDKALEKETREEGWGWDSTFRCGMKDVHWYDDEGHSVVNYKRLLHIF